MCRKEKTFGTFVYNRIVAISIVSMILAVLVIYLVFRSYGITLTSEKDELYRQKIEDVLIKDLENSIYSINKQVKECEIMLEYIKDDFFGCIENSELTATEHNVSYCALDYAQRISTDYALTSYLESLDIMKRLYFISLEETVILYSEDNQSKDHDSLWEVYDMTLLSNDSEESYNPQRMLIWTPVYLNETKDTKVVTCLSPVYIEDTFAGSVGMDVVLEPITNLLSYTTSNYVYSSYVTEGNTLVDYTDGLGIADKISAKKLLDESPQYDGRFSPDSSGEIEINGQLYLRYVSIIESMGWHHILLIKKSDTMLPINSINDSLSLYLVGANVLAVIFLTLLIFASAKYSKYVTDMFTSPLEELIKQIDILEVETNGPIVLKSCIKEVNILVKTLNRQQRRVADKIEQLIYVEKEKEKIRISNKFLHELSYKDMLTGLMNRREIELQLDKHLKQCNKEGGTFSVILLDIDFFKSVNDTFGHDVGDKVLQKISTFIGNELRSCDSFGRWGGEEFIVLCKDSDIGSARILSERIRSMVANAEFLVGRKITISIGVTEQIVEDDKYSIFRRVDKLLYKAKNTGRNKVCSS